MRLNCAVLMGLIQMLNVFMESSLNIQSETLDKNVEALSLLPQGEYRLAVVKGEVNDEPPPAWSMTLLPIHISGEILESNEACVVKIEGRDMVVYPSNLVDELEGKLFFWGGEEMELVTYV